MAIGFDRNSGKGIGTRRGEPRPPGRGLIGRIRNAPNTALGLLYGGLGYGLGKVLGTDPEISVRGNGVQFTNNPLAYLGAITFGETTSWWGDPFDPRKDKMKTWRYDDGSTYRGRIWHDDYGLPRLDDNGHTFIEHEAQHTPQGEDLSLFYLPSNVLGGLFGLVRDRDWHGPSNFNETGPQSAPPRPWRSKAR